MKYVNYLDTLKNAAKLSEKGEKTLAITTYLNALELALEEKDKLEPLYAMGIELKETDFEDAINYFNQCINIAEKFSKSSFYYSYYYNAHRELGEIYLKQKNIPKALLHFKKAYKEISTLDDDPETLDYLKDIIKLIEKKSA